MIRIIRRVLVGIVLMFLVSGAVSIGGAITKTDFSLKMPDELPNGLKLIDIDYLDSPRYTHYNFAVKHFPHFISCKCYIYSEKEISKDTPVYTESITVYEFESGEYAIADFQKLIFREPENAKLLSDIITEWREAGREISAELLQLERDIPNCCVVGESHEDFPLFQLDKYIVRVDSTVAIETAEMIYSLNKATQTPTPVPTPTPTATSTPSPSPTPEPPGFEAVFAIAGLLTVIYLLRRRK